MPGFSVTGGNNKQQKNNRSEYRRKHRWRVVAFDGVVPVQNFLELQKCSRPSFTLNEAIVHHDQEQAYFAGKQEWEPITLTFYDRVGGGDDISKNMYDWVNSVSDIPSANVSLPSSYKKSLQLSSTAADGSPDETWTLKGAWPSKCNWQDLDYGNNEIQLVEITIRFDRAERS